MSREFASIFRIHKPGQGLGLGSIKVLTMYALVSASLLFAQGPSAVTPAPVDGPSAAAAGHSAKLSREEIAKELDQMKKRIAELEAMMGKESDTLASPAEQPAANAVTPTALSAKDVSIATAEKSDDKSAQEKKKPAEPFAFADWTWLTGNPRTKDIPMDTKFFTPEVRFDANYTYSFNHPSDNTIGGSTEIFRSKEFQVTQVGVGGDFHFDNVRGRLMTQFGMYSTTTPRNDPTPAHGQWDLANAYRYISEAYGGYHWDKMHGINVDAGIFMSYIGLYSYYNFDNWSYQPSYVSSNTPWFFNGVRFQFFPTEKLKIEPWIINGWQSYGSANKRLGFGGQIAWRPNGNISIVSNNYGVGRDALGVTGRTRFHTDDSIQVKFYDHPERWMDKSAFTVTIDLGCESGGGVSCFGNHPGAPKQSFLGFMVYNRYWFHKDLYAVTVGGGAINNPGRYLVLLPPINGANAASGTPYFTENPGDPYKAYDLSGTFDYMPSQYITFRTEFNHRGANVAYFTGSRGITPSGGNQGLPGSVVPGFTPDLRKRENRMTMAILVKF